MQINTDSASMDHCESGGYDLDHNPFNSIRPIKKAAPAFRCPMLRNFLPLLAFILSAPISHGATWLWAWDRAEDLRWLAAGSGVAYFASQFDAYDSRLDETARRAPLHIPSGTPLLPVLHIEAFRPGHPPAIDAASATRWANALAATARRLKIRPGGTIQIDFEARSGQRDFYRDVLQQLRGKLLPGIRISITALASWCGDAAWVNSLPVDEIVPMYFRMGPAERTLWRGRLLAPGRLPAACRPAAGIALDEWPAIAAAADADQLSALAQRQLYLFSPRAWQPAMLDDLPTATPAGKREAQ